MKILFIDDSESFRILLHVWLNESDYKYIITGSVAEAKLILDKVKNIDLIICDLLMPSESGIMLLEYVKSTHSHIPVGIVSVISEKDYPTQSYSIKHRYIKPTDMTELQNIINDLIDKENIKEKQQ